MTSTPILRIPDAPPAEDTLNFQALMLAGTRLTQALSGDLWTDYNEHDPGVTILEALCYALTDLGYRTSHPFADILASSMAATGVKLSQQPLFTGNDLLSCAALTEKDYRKLVYDAVPGVRNAWLSPVADGAGRVGGLYDVHVQMFASVVSDRTPPQAISADEEAALSEVRSLLTQNRNLGEDFRDVRIIPAKPFAINAVMALSPGANAEATVARILFDVEMALNPTPSLEDIGKLMDAGVPPEAIFVGPKLDHGRIADDSLQPLRSEIPSELVLGVMNAVEGVENITNFGITLKDPSQRHAKFVAPTLSRSAEDLAHMSVLRNGVEVRLQSDLVLLHLRHLEDRLRWQVGVSMRRTTHMAYARVQTGNPKRQL